MKSSVVMPITAAADRLLLAAVLARRVADVFRDSLFFNREFI